MLMFQDLLSNSTHQNKFSSGVTETLGYYCTLFTPDMHAGLLSGSSSVLQCNIEQPLLRSLLTLILPH